MKKRNQTAGILALLGIAGGAFAWWKYKNMSAEEKAKLKENFNKTGEKIKGSYDEIEGSISEKYNRLKNTVKKEANKLAS